jgi:osmotically-inducible protein OsmY
MKKILMFAAILGFAATGFSQCTIQGISPEERQYRANPPRGYYSTQYVPQQYSTQDEYAPYGYRGPGNGAIRGQAGVRNYQGQPLKQTPYQYGGQQRQMGYQGPQGQQGQNASNDQQMYKDLSEQLKDYRLGITVKDGVVTLQGNVNSAQDKKKVEDIVYSYAGVKRVNNMVKVSGDQNQNQGYQNQNQGQGYQNNPSRNR